MLLACFLCVTVLSADGIKEKSTRKVDAAVVGKFPVEAPESSVEWSYDAPSTVLLHLSEGVARLQRTTTTWLRQPVTGARAEPPQTDARWVG